MSNFSDKSEIKGKITNEVLKRVKRLRNQIVESILDNNPFDVDFLCPRKEKENIERNSDFEHILQDCSYAGSSTIASRINGFESGTNTSDEAKASHLCLPNDLFCNCDICKTYNEECLKLKQEPFVTKYDLKSKKPKINESSENQFARKLTKKIQENYRSHVLKYLKYIDCIKITVHSLVLNQDGLRKLNNNQSRLKNNTISTGTSVTYFVEYHIPKVLLKNSASVKSKVDTRKDSSIIRICAKKSFDQEIIFKQSHVHDVINLTEVSLREIDFKFKISSRSIKQKLSNVLGYATFNLGLLEFSKNLSCTQDLVIEGDIPIDLGFLNVSIYLGCGKLYFGKEFVDAVDNSAKESRIVYNSDDDSLKENKPLKANKKLNEFSEKPKNSPFSKPESATAKKSLVDNKERKLCSSEGSCQSIKKSEVEPIESIKPKLTSVNVRNVKPAKPFSKGFIFKGQGLLVYGFVYISEAQYLINEPINSYIICYPFAQEDRVISRTVFRSLCPVFNFYQKIPYLLEDDFLLSLKNNFMQLEFWQKNGGDKLLGISKLPLHQLFVCYRHEDIIKQISENKYPVITSDWWEPIYSHPENQIKGHVKALVALGSEKQIFNLEIERGLKDNYISNNFLHNTQNYQYNRRPEDRFHLNYRSEPSRGPLIYSPDRNQFDQTYDIFPKTSPQKAKLVDKGTSYCENNCNCCTKKNLKDIGTKTDNIQCSSSVGINTDPQKFDAGVQVESSKMEPNKDESNSKTQEMLEDFLKKMMEQNSKVSREMSTNTDKIESLFANDKERKFDQTKLPKTQEENFSKKHAKPTSSASNFLEKINDLSSSYENTTNLHLRRTSDLLDTLQKALNVDVHQNPLIEETSVNDLKNKNYFNVQVYIEEALHLPNRKKCKSRRNRKKNGNSEESLPSYYVTFETESNSQLKITPIEIKTTNPRWDFRCEVFLSTEFLTNNQKRLIFKVWRKNGIQSSQQNLHNDSVLGFAALDLTVLAAGLPSVQGWFNIVDFSGNCNGQIKISITPLEPISRYLIKKQSDLPENIETKLQNQFLPLPKQSIIEEPGEVLGNALKRKFQELEEINQRLRVRLANVIQEDSDSNDDFSEAFESDMNMLCVEDDFETVNFDNIGSQNKSNTNALLLQLESNNEQNVQQRNSVNYTVPLKQSKSTPACHASTQVLVDIAAGGDYALPSRDNKTFTKTGDNYSLPENLTSLDQQLLQGKQRVDDLLQKISLITGNKAIPVSQCSESNSEIPFSSRYVSGCSVSQLSDRLMTSSTNEKVNNHGDIPFDTAMFEKLCSVSAETSTSSLLHDGSEQEKSSSIGSGSSRSGTSFDRHAPDGAGSSAGNKSFSTNTRNS